MKEAIKRNGCTICHQNAQVNNNPAGSYQRRNSWSIKGVVSSTVKYHRRNAHSELMSFSFPQEMSK